MTKSTTRSTADGEFLSDIDLGDNVKAKFGASDDLQIYHDGNNSVIWENGVGDLILRGTNMDVQDSGGYSFIKLTGGGTPGAGVVELKYNNAAKLVTTSTGVDVTGTVTADGLVVDGDVSINTGAGALAIDSFGGGSVQVSSNGAYKHISSLSSGYHLFEVNSKDVAKFNNNGDISFYEDTGTTPKFFWDASAESLGIGVTVPDSKLHISSGSTTDFITLEHTSGPESYIQNSSVGSLILSADGTNTGASSRIEFKVDNTERMRIDSSGNVGIGTSSPRRALEVYGDAAGVITIASNSTDGISSLSFGDPDDDNNGRINYLNASNNMLIYTNAQERMRIDSSGNVGIGTSSPLGKVSINSNGAPATSGSMSTGLTVSNSSSGTAINMGTYDAGGYSYIQSAYVNSAGTARHLAFLTGANERLRIDSSGNVLVGTMGGGSGQLRFPYNSASASSRTWAIRNDWSAYGDLAFVQSTTQAGTTFNAKVTLDNSGNVLVGKTSLNTNTAGLQLENDGYLSACRDGGNVLLVNRKSSDGALATFQKDGTTVGSIGTNAATLYVSAPQAGGMKFSYYNSTSAVIFPVTTTGSDADGTHDLGLAASRFNDIYATNGTIQTSDRNEKQDILAITTAESNVATACKGLLRSFRWKDSVVEKGDDARIHFGIIAQDLRDAFTVEGLDAGRYAMFISSTWWETQTEVPAVLAVDEVTDEDGNVTTEAVEAKDTYTRTDTFDTLAEAPEGATERTRLGVRYPELLAFIIAAL